MSLDSIRARAQAATEGPWEASSNGRVYDIPPFDLYRFDTMANEIADAKLSQADAEFIAHAREDIPRLLAALDAVEALAEKWETAFPYTMAQFRAAITGALGEEA